MVYEDRKRWRHAKAAAPAMPVNRDLRGRVKFPTGGMASVQNVDAKPASRVCWRGRFRCEAGADGYSPDGRRSHYQRMLALWAWAGAFSCLPPQVGNIGWGGFFYASAADYAEEACNVNQVYLSTPTIHRIGWPAARARVARSARGCCSWCDSSEASCQPPLAPTPATRSGLPTAGAAGCCADCRLATAGSDWHGVGVSAALSRRCAALLLAIAHD